MDITLSKEHGLNPTIPICFWCQKGKNEIAFLGAGYRGKAPMHMLFDYNPCDKCRADMARGITLVGVVEHEAYHGHRAINGHWESTTDHPKCKSGHWINPTVGALWPTGSWIVVTPEFIEKNFKPIETVEATLKHKRAYLEQPILQQILDAAGIKGDKNGSKTDHENGREAVQQGQPPPAGEAG